MRKIFVRSVPPLQTASRRCFSLQCKCKLRDIQTIQCVNILCKAVNNHVSNQSGHDTRIWYHKTAAINPQAPFLSFFLAPIPHYFSFRPIPHLGACSQASWELIFAILFSNSRTFKWKKPQYLTFIVRYLESQFTLLTY